MKSLRSLLFPLLTALSLGPATVSAAAEATPRPWLDRSLPLESRVEALLSRMSLEEKVGQLNMPCVYVSQLGESPQAKLVGCERFTLGTLTAPVGPAGGFFDLANEALHGGTAQQVSRFNRFQRIATEQTRLGIPLLQIEEGTHGVQCSGMTVFPEGPSLGSLWDMDLIREIYTVTAREARAVGIHTLCTLVVEPNRDPRLGRNQEGYSEDPWLCARIAGSIVQGVQGSGISAPDRAVATLCHFPGQSQPVSGLEQGAMEISERTLREVFLPPWESGIRDNGALGIMVTYPEIDGVPAHASRWLLTDVLRDELVFEGIALSEGDGFSTLIDRHVAADQAQAGQMSLAAGVDVDITYEDAYMAPLIESAREDRTLQEQIDRSVRRVLALKFRLGLFEQPYVDSVAALRTVHCRGHQDLALRAARESLVLLKNQGGVLPLNRGLRRIAVIGPNADQPRNQLGDYISNVILQPVTTVLEGVRGLVADSTEVLYVRGCNVIGDSLDEIEAARAAAARSQAAVLVLGENERMYPGGLGTDGEHKDVASLDLTGRQDSLLDAVLSTGTPTVVVLVNGRALSVRQAAAEAPAVIEAWLPGEKGGQAVAEAIFGEINPCGRMPVSVPYSAGQLPAYYNYKPSKAFALGRTAYVDQPARPLWEFGYGLSYTTFGYSDLEITPEALPAGDSLRVSLRLTNTGQRAGAEVVQLYLRDELTSVVIPWRQLRGFEKVYLEPGQSRRVEFRLGPSEMALLDRELNWTVEPGAFEVLVGASCLDIRLRGQFTVTE